MHFDFIYPSTFANANGLVNDALKKEQDKATGVAKAAMDCVSVPITAMDLTNGFNMIMLMQLDEACIGEETAAAELGAGTAAILSESLKQFGKPTISASDDYDIDGHSASTVSATVEAKSLGGVIHAAASCVISGKNLACFEFFSSDCPNVAVLASSTIKFGDNAPAAVIPNRLMPACKP